MKNILFMTMMALFLLGCSASNPTVSDALITSENTVTGQRILLTVNAITDNPSMTYQWTATGGVLDVQEFFPFTTFWTAPDTPGAYTITCTVTDKEKNKTSHTFHVQVSVKTLESNLVGANQEVITITKQPETMIGGIWASVRDNKLRFISSKTNEESVWSANFFTMISGLDTLSGLFTIWGVDSIGKDITVLTTASKSTLVCNTCFNTDFIRTMAKDVLDDTILWVGTDSGLLYYSPSGDPSMNPWGRYLIAKVNDLSAGPDLVYAATNLGLYKLDGKKEPLYEGDTCAVLAVDKGTSVEVWSVVQGKLQKDGKQLNVQPPVVVCSLDKDPVGNIWCGKYWWDGAQWHCVPGLESVAIVKSVASTEGLTYFISSSGALFRW